MDYVSLSVKVIMLNRLLGCMPLGYGFVCVHPNVMCMILHNCMHGLVWLVTAVSYYPYRLAVLHN